MRLLRVELSRFTSRRAVVLLVVAAALLTALVAGTTIWDTRPVSAGERAAAEAQAAAQRDSTESKRELAACRKDPGAYLGPDATTADCAQIVPTAENFLTRQPLVLRNARDDAGVGVAVLVAALMMIVGTTYAGADWATGSMSNQLLFEPRRPRVWLAKAAAVALGCALVAAVLLAGFWLALLVTAGARDIATPAAVRESIAWLTARGVVLGSLAGLGGFALTMLLRSTVATLALLFAYTAGGEVVLGLAPIDRPALWSPTNNVFAWIRDGVRVFDESVVCTPDQPDCSQEYLVSLGHGAAYLGALLLLALVASVVTFRRRDVP